MSTTITLAEEKQKKSGKHAAVKTAVVGVGGYAGGELARLLLHHPKLAGTPPLFLGRATGETDAHTVMVEDLHPQLALGAGAEAHEVKAFSWQLLADEGVDVMFLATPHEASREWVPELISRGVKVIDLSGAWRLQEATNRAVYKLQDADATLAATLQKEAVYGSPELHRAEIAGARLVANPGCYATSVILPLAPLVQAGLVDTDHGIVADAKSGVSGAGKAATAKTHFMYAADNLSAYAVFGHRHTGELLEQLGLTTEQMQFTPHLLPIPRGILSTIYVRLQQSATAAEIESCLRSFFAESPLVRIHATPHLPQIQHVVHTSYCDIGFELSKDGKRLVLISCLDNLLKGAASQAVQNMNLMCGFKEAEGLL
jgi:N-acetyl-gamma-glutamyl-phosphate reductase